MTPFVKVYEAFLARILEDEWQQWMNKEVYSTKKKEEQKNKLFEMMASEDSLKTFNVNEMKHTVNTASKYTTAYSNNENAIGRIIDEYALQK